MLFDVTWFFQGVENFKIIVVRNIIVKILYVISTFTFVKTKEDITLYMVIYCFSLLAGSLSMWVSLPRYLAKINFQEVKPFKNIKDILNLFIPAIAVEVYNVLDKIMILMFANNTFENGFYEQSEKIVKCSLTIIIALNVVMMPRNSSLFASNNEEAIKTKMKQTYRFVWLLGLPLMLGLFVCADYLIPVYLGPGYEKSVILMQILSVLVLVIGFNNAITIQYLVPTNRAKIFRNSTIIAAVLNVVVNLLFIPHYYSVGAAIGTIAAETSGLIYQMYYLIKNKIFCLRDFFNDSGKYFISTSAMVGVLLFLKNLLPISMISLLILTG